jgi:hypothetical protein
MNKIFASFFLCVFALSALAVSLQWDYPAIGYSTNLTFVFYSTSNLAVNVTNWPIYTNYAATNACVTNGGNLTWTLPVVPAATAEFFTCAASNMWGVSALAETNNFPMLDPELYTVFGLQITH